MENEKKQQINVELSPETAKGSFSNLQLMAHSKTEFILDFACLLPGMPKAVITDRIIMTPDKAKMLCSLLQDNIRNYEKAYGPISLAPQQPQKESTFNLGDLAAFNNGTKS